MSFVQSRFADLMRPECHFTRLPTQMAVWMEVSLRHLWEDAHRQGRALWYLDRDVSDRAHSRGCGMVHNCILNCGLLLMSATVVRRINKVVMMGLRWEAVHVQAMGAKQRCTAD